MLSRRPHLRIPLISLASKATKSDELCEGRKIMWKEGTIGIPGEKEVKKEYRAMKRKRMALYIHILYAVGVIVNGEKIAQQRLF